MRISALGGLGSKFVRVLGVVAAGSLLCLAPLSQASAASKKAALEQRKAAKPAAQRLAPAKAQAGVKAKMQAKAPAPAAKVKAAKAAAHSARHAVAKAKPAPQVRLAAKSSGRDSAKQHRVLARLDGRRPGPVVLARYEMRDSRYALADAPRAALRRAAHVPSYPAPRLSFGQLAGLHSANDPLELKSSVALVMDQDTHEVLVSKNDRAVLPIASLTKLMTGLIVSDAHLPLDEMITITQEDVDTEKGSRSRLAVGSTLTRGELLHLALMSSENRAAHALGRTYPGGISRFVAQMNARAMMMGMKDTRYVEPTGLSSANRSSAIDLATLVDAAYQDPLLRQLSTSPGYEVAIGNRVLQYNNTNRLVHNPEWAIGLQKTGYISEAGRCLVMQASVAGRKLIMVFLDSSGKLSRLADAERVRRWVEMLPASNAGATVVGTAPTTY